MRSTRKSKATAMTTKHPNQSSEHAASDEAAAYIAQTLMDIALQFEATHFAQIRRHYQSIAPTPDDDPRQFDLFAKHPQF
jgi:hypothetical protein